MIWPFGKKKTRKDSKFPEMKKSEAESVDYSAYFSYIQRDGGTGKDILSEKPRILFVSHPEDQEKCFHAVVDDLLNRVDAAVFYLKDSSPIPEQEVLDAFVEQINLLVIPITENIVTQKNWALDTVFPLAQKRHIPILALLQETVDYKVLNERCKHIEILDPGESDVNGPGFERRISLFLDSLFLNPEQMERIVQAFRRKVFISYRKSNRKHALAFMRKLHAEESCRDIATWFDDFLVPGENFDGHIRQQIDQCDLFTLIITQALLEPDNYVQLVEYPLAKQGDKPIFPISYEAVEDRPLRSLYPALGSVTTWDDPDILKKLSAALKDDGAEEWSPEKTYYIGLAYLTGYQVENNKEQGVAYIKTAAQQGFGPAMEKMSQIYTLGDGVFADPELAVLWYRKYTDYLETKRLDSQEAMEQYAESLDHLYQMYGEIGNLVRQKDVCHRKLSAVADIPDGQHFMQAGYLALIQVECALGDLVNCFLDLQSVQFHDQQTRGSLKQNPAYYETMADFFGALALSRDAEKVAAVHRLMEAVHKTGMPEDALREMDRKDALEGYLIALRLVDDEPSTQKKYYYQLSVLMKSIHLQIHFGDVAGAEDFLAVAKELLFHILQVNREQDFLTEQAELWIAEGEVAWKRGTPEKALEIFRKTERILAERYGRSKGLAEAKRMLLWGRCLLRIWQISAEENSLRDAQDIADYLIRLYPNIGVYQDFRLEVLQSQNT